MGEKVYRYVIVGGGLAGASAVKGIREIDKNGRILLACAEKHLPYHRPPLTKKLWFGKEKVEDIFISKQDFYDSQNVTVKVSTEIISIDAVQKKVTGKNGNAYRYEKLLIATGGTPRTLDIPGGKLEGVSYYRNLDDYLYIRDKATAGRSAVVIGGGFIGSEIAAALRINNLDVTMIFPSPYLVNRVFPEHLGRAIQEEFVKKGVRIINETPESITRKNGGFKTRTSGGSSVESDILIAGIGISPSVGIAEAAGLQTNNGIVVNQYLETSNHDIYAAGDNARFPYQVLGKLMRVEHWDNALKQGETAGHNMAGAMESFTYMPYFFSDLFEFGYEAVGEVDSGLQTFADWQEENKTGVVYYLKDGAVRGIMMCNVWEKVGEAREIIRQKSRIMPEVLRGAIR